jgi:hypothetical protein
VDKDSNPDGIDRLAVARAEYVQSNISLRALSKKLSIPLRTIARASKDGGWVAARARYGNKVEALSDDKAAEWQAEYLAKGRKLAAANALLLMEVIHNLVRGTKDKRAAAKAMLLDLTAKEAAELSKACGFAFKALCDAAGVSPVDEGSATVELPDDPAAELEAGTAKPVEGKPPMELISGKD